MIIIEDIKIYEYPDIPPPMLSDEITVGDMHGNALKLLHILIREEILRFTADVENKEEMYKYFCNIYDTMAFYAYFGFEDNPDNLKELSSMQNYASYHNDIFKKYNRRVVTDKISYDDLVKEFNNFLNCLEVHPASLGKVVRLIGDVFADRGSNDYFTLKILQLIKNNGIDLRILVSNHDKELIQAWEGYCKKGEFKAPIRILPEQTFSIIGLQKLLDERIVSFNKIIPMIEDVLIKSLRVCDYTVTEEEIYIYTHAPINPQFFLPKMAEVLKVTYKNETFDELAQTIQLINDRFLRDIVLKHKLIAEHMDADTLIDYSVNIMDMTEEERESFPFVYVIWNRRYDDIDVPENMKLVCGHIGPVADLPKGIINLDTNLGKTPRDESAGLYIAILLQRFLQPSCEKSTQNSEPSAHPFSFFTASAQTEEKEDKNVTPPHLEQ